MFGGASHSGAMPSSKLYIVNAASLVSHDGGAFWTKMNTQGTTPHGRFGHATVATGPMGIYQEEGVQSGSGKGLKQRTRGGAEVGGDGAVVPLSGPQHTFAIRTSAAMSSWSGSSSAVCFQTGSSSLHQWHQGA